MKLLFISAYIFLCTALECRTAKEFYNTNNCCDDGSRTSVFKSTINGRMTDAFESIASGLIDANEVTGTLFTYKNGALAYGNVQDGVIHTATVGDVNVSETYFPYASMFKIVWNAVILKAVDKGMINLSDKLSSVIPEYGQAGVVECSGCPLTGVYGQPNTSSCTNVPCDTCSDTTIDDMLNSRGGLASMVLQGNNGQTAANFQLRKQSCVSDFLKTHYNNHLSKSQMYYSYLLKDRSDVTTEEMYEGMLQTPLMFQPNSHTSYDHGMDLVGLYLDRVIKTSYSTMYSDVADFAQQEVFSKININIWASHGQTEPNTDASENFANMTVFRSPLSFVYGWNSLPSASEALDAGKTNSQSDNIFMPYDVSVSGDSSDDSYANAFKQALVPENTNGMKGHHGYYGTVRDFAEILLVLTNGGKTRQGVEVFSPEVINNLTKAKQCNRVAMEGLTGQPRVSFEQFGSTITKMHFYNKSADPFAQPLPNTNALLAEGGGIFGGFDTMLEPWKFPEGLGGPAGSNGPDGRFSVFMESTSFEYGASKYTHLCDSFETPVSQIPPTVHKDTITWFSYYNGQYMFNPTTGDFLVFSFHTPFNADAFAGFQLVTGMFGRKLFNIMSEERVTLS